MGDKTNAPFQIDFNVTAEPIVINGTTLIPMNETTQSCGGGCGWWVGGRLNGRSSDVGSVGSLNEHSSLHQNHNFFFSQKNHYNTSSQC